MQWRARGRGGVVIAEVVALRVVRTDGKPEERKRCCWSASFFWAPRLRRRRAAGVNGRRPPLLALLSGRVERFSVLSGGEWSREIALLSDLGGRLSL